MSVPQGDKQIKLVIIGDGAVGKTCFLIMYAKGEYPSEYVPTYAPEVIILFLSFYDFFSSRKHNFIFCSVFDNYTSMVQVNGEEVILSLWDTAGQEEYAAMRLFSYDNTDIFLVCYAVNSENSLENVLKKWVPEAKSKSPKARFILIGTKSDLRGTALQNDSRFAQPERAKQIAKQIKAVGCLECSALKNIGVKEAFDVAILAAVRGEDTGGQSCCSVL
ncbi:MAG: putative Cell division control protein 42 [Streblomastix strix]|uniref:Putative Cell division control protein 42 n=1 Tax=Streblomastix strix TaxID=222440 RepID=A0A5J4WYT5_9EUKA|nr:MAG: putative Cell division control protein 42 [Streblomastix strix]